MLRVTLVAGFILFVFGYIWVRHRIWLPRQRERQHRAFSKKQEPLYKSYREFLKTWRDHGQFDDATLRRIIYGCFPNYNDFYLLKNRGRDYPADAQLYQLVKFLQKKEINSFGGWNQPTDEDNGFIFFDESADVTKFVDLLRETSFDMEIRNTNSTTEFDHIPYGERSKAKLYRYPNVLWYEFRRKNWQPSWWINGGYIEFSKHVLSAIYKALDLAPMPNRQPLPGIRSMWANRKPWELVKDDTKPDESLTPDQRPESRTRRQNDKRRCFSKCCSCSASPMHERD